MFNALRILFLLLALLLAGVLDASAYATRGLENRVWENFSSLPETRPELALQTLEPQQEIWVLIYDPASGSTVWTKFDPEGLSSKKDRTDPDGFEWSDRDHHVVPRQVARDAGWDPEAKKVFDSAKVETPNRHNYSRHQHYSAEVGAEMADFLDSKKITNIGGVSAQEQVKLAQEFVEHIGSTPNQYIQGFNQAARGGPDAVKQWFSETGQHITLKATGQLPGAKDATVVKGIANTVVKAGGKVLKGVPIVAGVMVAGTGFAQGKTNSEVGGDVIMSVTGADLAEDAITNLSVYKQGEKAVREWRAQDKEAEDTWNSFFGN